MAQATRDKILGDFCDTLSGERIHHHHQMRAKALIVLQKTHGLSAVQRQSVVDFIGAVACVAHTRQVIMLEYSDDGKQEGWQT